MKKFGLSLIDSEEVLLEAESFYLANGFFFFLREGDNYMAINAALVKKIEDVT
jgi:hypothetical protein